MKRKFYITIIIIFSAFMLNVSAISFQQRYDRREDDEDYDPFVIEMNDMQVFKHLRNTWFYELPVNRKTLKVENVFFNDDTGFGKTLTVVAKPFLSCQLKFILIEYIGFYENVKSKSTYYYKISG